MSKQKSDPKDKLAKVLTKSVFTTAEVALLCSVAARTVSKWFDSKLLNGYRMPGSTDRRIPRNSLIDFMRSHGMDYSPLVPKFKVVVYADIAKTTFPTALLLQLKAIEANTFEAADIVTIATSFDLGRLVNDKNVLAVLFDMSTVDYVNTVPIVLILRQHNTVMPIAVQLPSKQGLDERLVGLVSVVDSAEAYAQFLVKQQLKATGTLF